MSIEKQSNKADFALQLLQMCMTVFLFIFLIILFLGVHTCTCTFTVESKECCFTLCTFLRFTFLFIFVRFHPKDSIVWAKFRFRTLIFFLLMKNCKSEKREKREMKCVQNPYDTARDLGIFLIHDFIFVTFSNTYIIFISWHYGLTPSTPIVSLWLSI